jgi:hypothetical protein
MTMKVVRPPRTSPATVAPERDRPKQRSSTQ